MTPQPEWKNEPPSIMPENTTGENLTIYRGVTNQYCATRYSYQQIQELVAAGSLRPEDFCRVDGRTNWEPISTVLKKGTPPCLEAPIQSANERNKVLDFFWSTKGMLLSIGVLTAGCIATFPIKRAHHTIYIPLVTLLEILVIILVYRGVKRGMETGEQITRLYAKVISPRGKRVIATGGTVIACGILVALSIFQLNVVIWPGKAYPGTAGGHMILALLLFLPTIPVLIGMKWGYVLARFDFGAVAVFVFMFAFNACAIEDVCLNRGSIVNFMLVNLLVAAVAAILFYCLGEHARLRKIYPVPKEGELTDTAKFLKKFWIGIGVILVLMILPGFAMIYLQKVVLPMHARAKQAQDLKNIQQCGEAFYRYAKDHNGNFPSTNTTSTDLFNELIKEGYITNNEIVAGSGSWVPTNGVTLTSQNVGWSCATGLTTNDNPGYALIWIRGWNPHVTNGNLIFDGNGKGLWGNRTTPFSVVYYVNRTTTNLPFTGYPNNRMKSFIATIPLHGPSTNVYTNFLNP